MSCKGQEVPGETPDDKRTVRSKERRRFLKQTNTHLGPNPEKDA